MEIACSTVTGCASNWSKEIIGVKINADQCPAFCYRISVTNSGTVELQNVRVFDSLLGDLTAFFNFPSSFSAGEGRTVHILDVTRCTRSHGPNCVGGECRFLHTALAAPFTRVEGRGFFVFGYDFLFSRNF